MQKTLRIKLEDWDVSHVGLSFSNKEAKSQLTWDSYPSTLWPTTCCAATRTVTAGPAPATWRRCSRRPRPWAVSTGSRSRAPHMSGSIPATTLTSQKTFWFYLLWKSPSAFSASSKQSARCDLSLNQADWSPKFSKLALTTSSSAALSCLPSWHMKSLDMRANFVYVRTENTSSIIATMMILILIGIFAIHTKSNSQTGSIHKPNQTSRVIIKMKHLIRWKELCKYALVDSPSMTTLA